MLRQVAEGVLVHTSEFMQSNAVVVHDSAGVLLIDPGVTGAELDCLTQDLRALGRPVVAGFSTHPHWDHLLWHAPLGEPPRYGTAQCAATVRERLSDAGAAARVAGMLPPDIADQIPLDLLGRITGLPADATVVPWDGPEVRVVEHQGHAPGHAALVIAETGVLVAGDMLSDILIPILDLNGAADPVESYLEGLRLLEDATDGVDVVIPGHGSVGGAGDLRVRIDQDRAYVQAVRDVQVPTDPRLGPSATFGQGWLPGLHDGQVSRLAERNARTGTPE